MKKRDRRSLGLYVRAIADQLELRDWTIEIQREPCDESVAANAHCVNGQRVIIIAFCSSFRDHPLKEQRETVVHELLHAHHEACWKMVQSDLSDALGKPTYYVFADSYRRNMEYAVDAISKALAKHLPLIDWPK